MASEIIMPRLSDSMEQGVVLGWLVEVGAEIHAGQELVEIETDKATMTYEAEDEGTLLSILVGPGETALVGAPIALLGSRGEVVAPAATAAPAVRAGVIAASPADGRSRSAPPPGPRIPATPVARRLAAAYGIKLAPLTGTGPHGRIVKGDVLRAVAAESSPPDPHPAVPANGANGAGNGSHVGPEAQTTIGSASGSRGDVTTTEPTRVQQLVARRMSESRAVVPDFEVRVDVDMSACVELRDRIKAIADPRPSFNDMIIRASALALRDHRRANGSFADGRFELYSRVNVGFAVAADDALVVPTVFDADRASLGEIARATRALAAKVRDGSITAPELTGGTFTVSNLGMFGVDAFSAVINQPQAAILAVGAIRKRAIVAADDSIVARPVLTLALAADHRIIYGAAAARLLDRIRELLEHPLALAIL